MTDHAQISGLLLRLTWGSVECEGEDELFLEVTATDGGSVWSGSVSHQDLQVHRASADLTPAQHHALTKRALVAHTSQPPSLSSSLSSSLLSLSGSLSLPAARKFHSEVTGEQSSAVRNLVWKYDVEDPVAGRIKVLIFTSLQLHSAFTLVAQGHTHILLLSMCEGADWESAIEQGLPRARSDCDPRPPDHPRQ